MRHVILGKPAQHIVFTSLLSIPLIVNVYMMINFHYISNDGVQYVDLGYRLFHYGIYNSAYGVVPGWIQSPGFPVILGFFSLFLSKYVLGHFVCFILTAGILLILFRFSKREINIETGEITLLLIAVNPWFLRAIMDTSSEPFYTLIHFTIFIILYNLVFYESQLKIGRLLILVLLCTLLYQIRSEGILVVVLTWGILIWKKKWHQALLFILLISIINLPYGLWIKSQTGKFNILPKITFNARVADIVVLAEHKMNIRSDDPRKSEDIGWYLLDTDYNELYASNLLNEQYYHNRIRNELIKPSFIKKIPERVYINIKELFRTLIMSSVFPLIFNTLIGLGIFYILRRKIRFALFLLIWLSPSLYFMISHVEERFFYVLLPYLGLIAGFGVFELSKKIRFPFSLRYLLMILVVLNSTYYYYIFYNEFKIKERNHQIAKEIKKEIPPEKTVCARNYQITFYSGDNYLKFYNE